MPTETSVRAIGCRHCAIHDSCTLGRLARLDPDLVESQLRERIFHRDDVLLNEGKIASFVRVVKMGTVFCYRRGLDGRSRPIGVVGPGHALGVLGTFNMPSQATCVALSKVRVCELPVATLHDHDTCGSRLMAHIAQAVVESVAVISTWSEAMRVPGVVGQLAYVAVLLADANRATTVELPSHSALAELLGTRRETIARALRTLEREGCIRRFERKRCEIYRSKLLARLSHIKR